MSKSKQEYKTEKEMLEDAAAILSKSLKDDSRFKEVDFWRECGEWGMWVLVYKPIEDIPEEFMDFEIYQKVVPYFEQSN